ncbi:MAG: hypothetical protein IBX56_15160 [Methylomicrobium sp.]|nr:hypothetical protein [Methylomicrobium sp.]
MENKKRIRKKEGVDIIDANSGPCRGLERMRNTRIAPFYKTFGVTKPEKGRRCGSGGSFE